MMGSGCLGYGYRLFYKWFKWLTAWIRIENARMLCLGVAGFHLFLAVIFFGLTMAQDYGTLTKRRLVTPVTATIGLWIPDNMYTEDNNTKNYALDALKCSQHSPHARFGSAFYVKQFSIDAGEVDTRWLIIVFHFLSFIFQYTSAKDGKQYVDVISNGDVHVGHYFEYSISASVMIVAICAQLGVTDFFLVLNVALNCFSCMIFGAVAEICFKDCNHASMQFKSPFLTSYISGNLSLHWLAHICGWVVFLFGTLPGTLSNIMLNNSCVNTNGSRMPDWVLGLVSIEMILFACFGLVQFFSFLVREKNSVDRQRVVNSAVNTEFAYIILSALAKTILGVGVFAGNMANN